MRHTVRSHAFMGANEAYGPPPDFAIQNMCLEKNADWEILKKHEQKSWEHAEMFMISLPTMIRIGTIYRWLSAWLQ